MRICTLVCMLLWSTMTFAEVPKLDLEEVGLKSCDVLLDRKLLPQREQIEADLQAMVAAIHDYDPKKSLDPQATSKRWIMTLAGLLKIPEDDPRLVERQAKLEQGLEAAASIQIALSDRPTIYVLDTKTMRPYLEAGGSLPGIRYSRGEDTFDTTCFSGFQDGSERRMDVFTVPFKDDWESSGKKFVRMMTTFVTGKGLDADDPDAKEVAMMRDVFLDMRDKMGVISLHVCVIDLLGDDLNKSLARHMRWLHAALIDYYSDRTLRESGDTDYADAVQAIWGDKTRADAEHPDPSVSLRYWTADLGALDSSGAVLNHFNNRRRARAQVEFRRLIEKVGEDALLACLRQLAGEGIDSREGYEQAIKARLDYDIGARLALYQPAETPDEVYSHAISKYMKARDANDPPQALVNLLIALEAQYASEARVNTKLYDAINDAVKPFNDAELACSLNEVFLNLAIAEQLDTDEPRPWQYVMYAAMQALRADQPKHAFELLEHKDEIEWPAFGTDNVKLGKVAVDVVQAHRLIKDGEFDQAQTLLDRAEQRLDPIDNDQGIKDIVIDAVASARERLREAFEKHPLVPK